MGFPKVIGGGYLALGATTLMFPELLYDRMKCSTSFQGGVFLQESFSSAIRDDG